MKAIKQNNSQHKIRRNNDYEVAVSQPRVCSVHTVQSATSIYLVVVRLVREPKCRMRTERNKELVRLKWPCCHPIGRTNFEWQRLVPSSSNAFCISVPVQNAQHRDRSSSFHWVWAGKRTKKERETHRRSSLLRLFLSVTHSILTGKLFHYTILHVTHQIVNRTREKRKTFPLDCFDVFFFVLSFCSCSAFSMAVRFLTHSIW